MKSVSICLLAVWLPGLGVVLAAPAPDPQAGGSKERAQVEAAVQAYAAAIRGKAETLANLFAADGELIQPGLDPLVGPEAIRTFLAPFAARVKIEEATMTSRAIDLYGDEAYVWGDYSQTVAVGGEKPAAKFTGRFVAQWHRTAGAWKLRRMLVQPAPAS
ncbi:MAG TPA: nuclear transport factor 2 family protein [Thermoanaerobaculia bacterium]|jgi:uncharacterized protein (TIGR02246 family)|nr:nuclear transport factor 2 family protein [Thermoanaerobaculia bacterium]